MSKGYVILTEDVLDAELMRRYGEMASPLLAEFGGRLLAVGDDAEVPEGEWQSRTVLVEFDSLEDARRWYWSDQYQEATAVRKKAADCRLVIMSGLPS